MKTEPDIQNKPPHREGIYFDDEQRIVLAVWPHVVQAPEEAILDALEDAGARFSDRENAADTIAAALDKEGDKRGAEMLVMFFNRLPGGRRGDELRAAFLGAVDNETLRESAKRHGVSHVTWFKALKRLRAKVFRKTANASGY